MKYTKNIYKPKLTHEHWSLNKNICLLFCMVYLHCKFDNVIKINYDEDADRF